MYGTARGTGYGYSLWEFQVYGASGTSPSPTGTPAQLAAGQRQLDSRSGATTSPAPPAPARRRPTGCCAPAPRYPGGAANWGTGEVETDERRRPPTSSSTAPASWSSRRSGTAPATGPRAGSRPSAPTSPPAAGEQIRFSAVLKQPDVANALGYWPGFRATGAAYRGNYTNWPGVGETDIMTDVNGRSQLANTLHCGTAPDGPCATSTTAVPAACASCVGCQTGYHEYAEVIDRTKTDEEIRFYLDGKQTWVGPGESRSASPPGTRPCTTASTCASTWPSAARCRTRSPAAVHADRRHHLRRRAQRRLGLGVPRDRYHAGRDDRPGRYRPGRAW